MGKHKTNVMSSEDKIKIVADPTTEVVKTEAAAEPAEGTEAAAEALLTEAPKKAKKIRNRSGKYVAIRAKVDKTKKYDLFAAVELLKKLSYTSFPGTITIHGVVKEAGASASVTLPHSTGKAIRVAIVDDALLESIAAGKLDFDVLLASPKFMGKLAKYAPVLGPKGLMPNPKNGTLTPNPELQKKKLEGGTVAVRTEKKAPLFHFAVGKTSMDTKELVENVEAVLKAMGNKLVRVSLAATMSPGVKLNISAEIA